MRSKQKDTALKANYRKLWLKERVDKEFMVQTLIIHDKFNLPITNIPPDKAIPSFLGRLKREDTDHVKHKGEKYNIISKQAKREGFTDDEHLNLVKSLIQNLPSMKFFSEVGLLAERTGFSKKWILHLIVYLITDKIIPPTDKADMDVPPSSVFEDYQIFIERAKADVLRKHEGKNAPTYLNIYQKVFVEENIYKLTDDELKAHEKRILNLVKKRYQRFIETYKLRE